MSTDPNNALPDDEREVTAFEEDPDPEAPADDPTQRLPREDDDREEPHFAEPPEEA